jgi:beta-galactosidase/beta-glucuronidase
MKKYDFNQGWTFFKQGEETGRTVRLPHDAMIHEQRNPQSPGGSAVAHFPGGVYEYEKTFDAPETWANQHVVFQFEGVYRNAKVFINGKEAGGRPYGYIPFFVEADGFLNYGAQNTIRVIADNSALPNSRWYSGSGIYRPVWLWTGPKTRINIEGVKIATLSYSPARIKIDVSHTGGDAAVEILRKGTPVASGVGDNITLEIPNAKLWSDESPELYECRVVLKQDGVAVDEVTETFGIRFVEWNRNGLFINGKKTLLRGGCVHHDNGILGARCYAASEERRVRIMKQAGFNAIRSAHNPASKAMLAACDKYGVYMMDETWDMWYMHKNKCDYASDFMDNYKADIEAMVNRDFNHPSVILYSIGNEITEPFQEKGVEMARELAACFRALDKNRAVTGGISLTILYFASKGMGIYKEDGSGVGSIDQNKPGKQNKQQMTSSTLYNFIASTAGTMLSRVAKLKAVDRLVSPCMDALDIAGYNYAALRYPLEAKLHPPKGYSWF